MELTQVRPFNFLRDLVLFCCAVSGMLLFLLLFFPQSVIPGFTLFSLPIELQLFLASLIDFADGILCTFIFTLLLFRFFLWRSGMNVILGTALFFTGLLLTQDYLLFVRASPEGNEGFTWFLTHCFYTISLAFSLGMILFGTARVRIHTTSFILFSIALLFLLWIGAISESLFLLSPNFQFVTDSLFLYFYTFEAIPFFIYLLLCIPLMIWRFVTEKTYTNYGLLFSSLSFSIAYALNLLLPNENYFRNTGLYGTFELFGFFIIALGVLADTVGIYYLLKDTSARVEQLTEAKNNFISNFSAQLKTPLDIIVGNAENLEEGVDGSLTEKQKESVHLIQQESNKLLQLIDEIIDISRIESGKISYDLSRFSLTDTCSHISTLIAPKVEAKGLRLQTFFPDEELFVYSDEQRIKQILFHLLENSIQYTEKGSISLKIEEVSDGILLSISDTGKGMPKSMLQTLFEPYTHIQKSVGKGALGISLAISQLITHALNTKLDVQSEEGRGTTFSFRLPKGSS